MNVLIVLPWDLEAGGVVAVAGHLARRLAAAGHRPLFLHFGDENVPQATVTKWGFPGYRLRRRSPFRPPDESGHVTDRPLRTFVAFWVWIGWTLFQLSRLLRRHRIDIVNIHYPTEYDVYFGLLRWLGWGSLIVSAHGADLFPHGRPRPRYSWTLRLLLAAADALVTPSASMRDEVAAAFPTWRAKITPIHNGVDLEEFAEAPTKPPAPQEPYVLCVALHNRRKGLDVLLQAFARMSVDRPGLELWLAGDGPLRKELEALSRRLRLDTRVRFLGMASRVAIRDLMRACRLFVLPSRAEPFGLVILEAVASQRPVVATAVGGIPEIIRDGETGLLVPPDDPEALARAMSALLDDPDRAERLARHAYEDAHRRFAWEVMASHYVALFGTVHTRRGVGAVSGRHAGGTRAGTEPARH